MKTEKKFKNLIEKAKNIVFLAPQEKEEIRASLVSFMKDNPIKKEGSAYAKDSQPKRVFVGYNAAIASLITSRPLLKYASLASLFLIFIFVSISLAAKNSLPGQALYPVKVSVNEKVLSFIMFSDESKAKYNVRLAELRLEESETIAFEKKLDNETAEKIKLLLDKHVKNANNYSKDKKSKSMPNISTEIQSELEASLNAHSQILNNLAQRENNGVAKSVKNILSDVEKKTEKTRIARQESENELSLKPTDYLKDSAENKIKEAEEKVSKVRDFVNAKKEDININSYQEAEENLNSAKDIILQAKEKFQIGEYIQAFSISQEAVRLAKKTQINLSASIKLKLDISNKGKSGSINGGKNSTGSEDH